MIQEISPQVDGGWPVLTRKELSEWAKLRVVVTNHLRKSRSKGLSAAFGAAEEFKKQNFGPGNRMKMHNLPRDCGARLPEDAKADGTVGLHPRSVTSLSKWPKRELGPFSETTVGILRSVKPSKV